MSTHVFQFIHRRFLPLLQYYDRTNTEYDQWFLLERNFSGVNSVMHIRLDMGKFYDLYRSYLINDHIFAIGKTRLSRKIKWMEL